MNQPSRRQVIQTTAAAAAAMAVPHVFAAEDSVIRLAIIGCGPRGRGALVNAMSSPNGPCKIVAMADLFQDRIDLAMKSMTEQFRAGVDCPVERQFLGFDAYKKAIDCLRPGIDVALLTTRAAFRPTHLEYAVSKGVNIFMEKSFSSDPGGIHRVIKCGEIADQKGIKLATGLQCRHSTSRQAMIQKIRDGAMGDLQLIRAYRMDPGWRFGPRKGKDNEVLYQIRNSVAFIWGSTGLWMENMVHQVDECCWLKDAWPVSAHGLGGRAPDSTDCGQNLETYAIEYAFADGSRAMVNGRFMPKCHNDFATYVHGTKCAGQFSGNIHAPTVHLYKDHRASPDNIAWKPEEEKVNPWQAEWDVLLDAVHKNRPHNEAKRGALANLAAIMGRAACHMGRIITWEEAMASKFMFCPNIDTLNENSEPPVRPDAQGRYPAPVAGKWTEI